MSEGQKVLVPGDRDRNYREVTLSVSPESGDELWHVGKRDDCMLKLMRHRWVALAHAIIKEDMRLLALAEDEH